MGDVKGVNDAKDVKDAVNETLTVLVTKSEKARLVEHFLRSPMLTFHLQKEDLNHPPSAPAGQKPKPNRRNRHRHRSYHALFTTTTTTTTRRPKPTIENEVEGVRSREGISPERLPLQMWVEISRWLTWTEVLLGLNHTSKQFRVLTSACWKDRIPLLPAIGRKFPCEWFSNETSKSRGGLGENRLSHLRTISLHHLSYGARLQVYRTKDLVPSLMRQCRELTTLDLRGTSPIPADSSIWGQLQHMEKLRHLYLPAASSAPSQFQWSKTLVSLDVFASPNLATLTSPPFPAALARLGLGATNLTTDALLHLLSHTVRCVGSGVETQLKHLVLSRNPVCDLSLALLDSVHSLERLELASCPKITSLGLAAYLSGGEAIGTSFAAQNETGLQDLDLSGNVHLRPQSILRVIGQTFHADNLYSQSAITPLDDSKQQPDLTHASTFAPPTMMPTTPTMVWPTTHYNAADTADTADEKDDSKRPGTSIIRPAMPPNENHVTPNDVATVDPVAAVALVAAADPVARVDEKGGAAGSLEVYLAKTHCRLRGLKTLRVSACDGDLIQVATNRLPMYNRDCAVVSDADVPFAVVQAEVGAESILAIQQLAGLYGYSCTSEFVRHSLMSHLDPKPVVSTDDNNARAPPIPTHILRPPPIHRPSCGLLFSAT